MHTLINAAKFSVNMSASELIKQKPNEVILSKNLVELKKSLSLLTEGIESLQSNLYNGS